MAIPPGFTPYPRPEGLFVGVRPLPPGAHIEAIGEAWNLFTKQWTTWVLTTLVFFAIYIGLYLPLLFLVSFLEYGTASLLPTPGQVPSGAGLGESFICFLVFIIVMLGLASGMLKMALNQLRGQPIAVGDLFGGFRYTPRMLGGYFCFAAMYLIGIVLCFIPALWVLGAFSLTPFLIIDQEKGVFESLGGSFRAAGSLGMGLSMFGLLFLLGLVNAAGAVACGVGILASTPVVTLAMAIHYYYFFPEAFATSAEPSLG